MRYRYPDHYVVELEKIREYAIAVKNDDAPFFEEKAAGELGHDGLLAPLTFISVFGYKAVAAFFEHAKIATEDAQFPQNAKVILTKSAERIEEVARFRPVPKRIIGKGDLPVAVQL